MTDRRDDVAGRLESSALAPRTALLVRLSAALGAGRATLRETMDDAARAADPVEVEEVVLQSYLFLGFPATLSALGEWRQRVPVPRAQLGAAEDTGVWRARGEEVCERVYAGAYQALRSNVRRLHPDVERWMLEEGYGKVLGRPPLGLRDRELCIVALLAGLDAPHQLHSHMRGALNVGASPDEVDAALGIACALLPVDRADAAREVWTAVRERWRTRDAGMPPPNTRHAAGPSSASGQAGATVSNTRTDEA